MNKTRSEFKESFIFEKEKDKALVNAKAFKLRCEVNYNYKNVFGIYRKIIDYQIKKYGCTLENDMNREYNKNFHSLTNKIRKNTVIKVSNNQKQERFIERIERLQGDK